MEKKHIDVDDSSFDDTPNLLVKRYFMDSSRFNDFFFDILLASFLIPIFISS